MGSVWCRPALAKNVGTFHHQKKRGPDKEELELVRHSNDLRLKVC